MPTHIKNKVSRAIEPHRCALLIHDMQPHYLSMVPAVARSEPIANTNRVTRAHATKNIPLHLLRQ
jgi:isochorismate hydrolase